ncbi:MAG: NAD(P)-dependent oxidoreductase [Lachnospiraceae bacterium]|nr:NAD(P)-dependent oxidoreductase [Lachnospiraceae bacterium]
MKKHAMITGADGFIGRNLVAELLEQGWQVTAVVRNTEKARGLLGTHEKLRLLACDMNHYTDLADRWDLGDVSVLFHLAWAGVSDQSSMEYEIQLNNVKCSCDLQRAAQKLGIPRLVYAGSIMEFEHQKALDSGYYQVSLRNTYPVAKTAARSLLQIQAANGGMEYIPVIISNIYGPGENSPRLINTAIRSLLDRKHMSFTRAEQMYDFIYIRDAVRAIRMAGEQGKNNRLYYIGSKRQMPLKQYLFRMRDLLAPDMELGLGEIPFKGVSLTFDEFDTQGLYEDFGFTQEYTFEEGVRLTAEAIQEAFLNKGRV